MELKTKKKTFTDAHFKRRKNHIPVDIEDVVETLPRPEITCVSDKLRSRFSKMSFWSEPGFLKLKIAFKKYTKEHKECTFPN